MPLSLALNDVYLRSGPAVEPFDLGTQLRPAKPFDRLERAGVLLYWPRAVGWLRLSARAAGIDPAGVPFADTVTALDAAAAAHRVDRARLAPAKFLEGYAFLVASVGKAERVLLTVEVDTDDAGFREAVRVGRDPGRGELVVPVRVKFFDAAQFGREILQDTHIDLALRPCAPQPAFRGPFAVDLGNTTTTAVALPAAETVHRTASLRAVPLEAPGRLAETAEPLESVVRLDLITSAVAPPPGVRRFPSLAEDERRDAIRFVAGRLAAAGDRGGELPAGVVFGAKQLLTTRPPATGGEPVVALTVPHARTGGTAEPERVEVLNRVPGELLFAHAVQRFRQATGCWPPELTLTYPTTYGPAELHRLRTAAARGWLRALGLGEAGAAPDEDDHREAVADEVRRWLTDGGADPRLLPCAVDEASAAAFFHLYRRVFERPGGLARFRYLHPDGLRLLLVDCGGGTTDVALVSAHAPAGGEPRLNVEVLARTGVRTFGGDRITRAACRLVKAKLIAALARWRLGNRTVAPLPLAVPDAQQSAAVEEFIRRAGEVDPTDAVAPTRFDPARAAPADAPRRTCAHALRELGEAVKQRLGAGRPIRLKELDLALLTRDTSPLMAAAVGPLPPAEQPRALAAIGDITVSPWELDALVRDDVGRVIDRCNRLIHRVLVAGAAGREEEVDWVVVSGNGSRYPLVRRLLRERLAVPQVAARMETDDTNIKLAVAKGAALVRMIQGVPDEALVVFTPPQLSDLLPFDVGYHTRNRNETVPLFREYTPYARLEREPQRVRVQATGRPAGSTFYLSRRYPGDDEWFGYASYHFESGIGGELEVRFDPRSGEFEVIDVATGAAGVFTAQAVGEGDRPLADGDI